MSRSPGRWAGLLVSVRDADEAIEAVAGGAAIVDVKEPAHGPLGAASPAAAAAVAAVVADRVPCTLACGELADGAAARAAASIAALSAGATLPACAALPAAAKAGPARLTLAEWRPAYAAFAAALPPGVEAIAVAYADWRTARAPDPAGIIAAAAEAGAGTLLIDTLDKHGPGVMDAGAVADVAALVARARAAGLAVAVAGRVGIDDIGGVAGLGADVVAVRSAVCRGGRMGRVDRALVARAVAGMTAHRAGRWAPA